MTQPTARALVVGSGIFGVTAALALRRRGFSVTLVEAGDPPHPQAESTDISKVVRMDYGPDEEYMALGERALAGWREWNESFETPLYHETGVAFVSRGPMLSGSFEHESYHLLRKRGHRPERLDAQEIATRFPAWRRGSFTDGYFNPDGGFAESGKVVSELLLRARQAGVDLRPRDPAIAIAERSGRVEGVRTASTTLSADTVIVAAGSWTPLLVPRLAPCFRAVGQPVFHLQAEDKRLFEPRVFPVFGADISRTGWYGFPATAEGIVKIANHGVGRIVGPKSLDRQVTGEEEERLRSFLVESLPMLASAPIVGTRLCVYCDTWDEHFWIDRDPEVQGLVVAAGGSGHAFKFAPLLGDLIADAAGGQDNPPLHRFRWRPEVRPPRGEEAARCRKLDAYGAGSQDP